VNFIPQPCRPGEVLARISSRYNSGNPVGGVINIVLRPNVDTRSSRRLNKALALRCGIHRFPPDGSLARGNLRASERTFTKTMLHESELGYIQSTVGASGIDIAHIERTPHRSSTDALVDSILQLYISRAWIEWYGGLDAFTAGSVCGTPHWFDLPRGVADSRRAGIICTGGVSAAELLGRQPMSLSGSARAGRHLLRSVANRGTTSSGAI